MNLKKFFNEKPFLAFSIGVCAILFISLLIFLFSKGDPKNPESITGLQAVKLLNWNFWLWVFLGIGGLAYVIPKVIKYFNKEQDTRSFGNYWIAFGLILLIIFWQGCETKANDGKTGHKLRPGFEKLDDGRGAAEDQLKK